MGLALDRQVEQIGDRLARAFGGRLAGGDEPPQRARVDDEHQRRSRSAAISSEAGAPPTDDWLRMRDSTCSGD